jgi:hypothetical protein
MKERYVYPIPIRFLLIPNDFLSGLDNAYERCQKVLSYLHAVPVLAAPPAQQLTCRCVVAAPKKYYPSEVLEINLCATRRALPLASSLCPVRAAAGHEHGRDVRSDHTHMAHET